MTVTRVFAAGDLLGERYMLRQSVWTSALGPVWLARDRVLERQVFVQMLSPELAEDRAARRAFQKAAGRVAQVSHPGLLQVFDIGDDPAFVVFEHAPGGRLADRLRAGPLRTVEAVRATLALARALEALHARGSWHGSLSPASVVFGEDGRAKLLAEGTADVARAAGGAHVGAEQPASYRPPEREPLPADADRYALAALSAHMLTGKPPERGQIARGIRRIPGDIEQLLRRALGPDPASRPTLDEFESALAPYARVEPKKARRPHVRLAELGWLVPVIVIVALATLAATFGVQFARDLARRSSPSKGPTASPSPSAGAPITVKTVTDFDPYGSDKHEHPEEVGLAIDGDPGTAWQTVGYSSANVGGKPGVGLVFDLGSSRRVARVRVQSTLPGWTAEVRVSDQQGSGEASYRPVTTFTAGRDTMVPLPAGTRGRYVLLWITKLVDDGSGSTFPFRAAVADVSFFGP